MNFKRYVEASDTWVDSHYIMSTSTDTITTPADIYANDTTATVGLKGNMSQTGTPTPDNPIQPSECGERTGNLSQWEKGGISTTTGADEAYKTAEQGGTCEQMRSLYIPCYGNTNYVLHTNHYPVQSFISYYDADKNYISRSSGAPQGENRGFTTPEMARYMRAQLAHVITNQVYPAIEENQQYAITFGSTPLPYEPYGIKIPISSANTTTPVYLGEVETTRKVKKFVLTGQEGGRWAPNSTIHNGNAYYNAELFTNYKPSTGVGYCSHYPLVETITATSGAYFGSNINFITDFSEGIDDRDKWIAYLQQQYANGTPVTVWYVLATETTGIVNEPIRKIGDYADEVSGITIPTIAGANTLSVDTTLQPSEVSVNYKGWHPVQSVYEKSMNLFDINTVGIENGTFNPSTGATSPNDKRCRTTNFISLGLGTYTLATNPSIRYVLYVYDTNENYVQAESITAWVSDTLTFTLNNDRRIKFGFSKVNDPVITPSEVQNIMLNTGNTALPYEPYWK